MSILFLCTSSFLHVKCVYIYIIFINVSQEKLNGLTILSIEQELLENIEYKSLINNFNNFFFLLR
jgi:hypothetical protein